MAFNIRTSRQVGPDLEILAHITGNEDVAESIVLDASTFPLNTAGERELLAGTPLVKNVNNQYQAYQATASYVNQTVAISATGGTFTLTHNSQTTAAIGFDATAAQVKAALEALSTITDGSLEVDKEVATAPARKWTVTFTVPAEALAITGTGTSLTGGSTTVTVASTLSAILGILNHTERVPDTLSHSDVPSAMWNFGQWFRSDRIVGWASNSAAIKAALTNCKFS